MATPNNAPNAILLRPLSRYPNAAVWGFPYDNRLIISKFDKTDESKLPEPEFGDALMQFTLQFLAKLHAKCSAMWYSPSEVRFNSVHVRNAEGRIVEKDIICIVRATQRDDRFLPPPEKIEKLKRYLNKQGLTDEPGWFRALYV